MLSPLLPPNAPKAAFGPASPHRFVVLALYASATLSSAMMWLAMAPIAPVAQAAFDVTASGLNVISLLFLVVYPLGAALCSYLLVRVGLRWTLTVGVLLDALGCTLKWVGAMLLPTTGAAFACLVGGQTLGAIAQPLILNTPTRLTADWFPATERDLATVVATMANVLGQMLGSLVPPLIVTGSAATADTPAQLRTLLLWTGVVPNAATVVLMLLLLRERPPHPPSASAAQQWRERDDVKPAADGAGGGVLASTIAGARAYAAEMATMLRDRDFVFLAGSFSVATAMSWSLLTVQAQIVTPCVEGDGSVAGDSGAALLGIGVLTSFAIGPVLERSRRFALIQRLLVWASAAASLFVLAVNRPGSRGIIIGAWCVFGAFVQPLLPVALEHAAEITHPLPPDASASFLLTSANIVGVLIIVLLGCLLGLPVSANCSSVLTPAAGVVVGFMAVGAALALGFRHKLVRSRSEQPAAAAAGSLNADAGSDGDGNGSTMRV